MQIKTTLLLSILVSAIPSYSMENPQDDQNKPESPHLWHQIRWVFKAQISDQDRVINVHNIINALSITKAKINNSHAIYNENIKNNALTQIEFFINRGTYILRLLQSISPSDISTLTDQYSRDYRNNESILRDLVYLLETDNADMNVILNTLNTLSFNQHN